MLVKAALGDYGDRLVLDPGKREAVVREVHCLGHAGISRVAGAVVENYYWVGMKKDVKRIVYGSHCQANKRKLMVVAPLKPTALPIAPFDLVAIDLMTLTRSYIVGTDI